MKAWRRFGGWVLVGMGAACSSDPQSPAATGGQGGAVAGGGQGGVPAAGQAGGGQGGSSAGQAGIAGQAGGTAGQGGSQACAEPAGAPSFQDASARWSLDEAALSVQGNRLMAADLDGDGYPDLIVHRITTNTRTVVADAQADASRWLYRVLMNRPAPDGQGRTFVDATLDSHYGDFTGSDGTLLRAAHLAAAADLDNDGDLDLFSGTNVDPTADPNKNPDPGDRSQILLNDGHGVFSLATPSDATPAAASKWPTTGASFADVDRDGKVDLFVGFWYKSYGSSSVGVQAQLYRGQGDGSFAATTTDAGLATQAASSSSFAKGKNHRPAYGVTACDLDGDGSAELMVSAYGRQWNLLYQNDGQGSFTDVSQESGFAGDDNQDISDNQFFACYCTVHKTEAACAGVKPPLLQCPTPADAYWSSDDAQPWRNNGNTFSTFCGDIDGDGKNDLLNAEIAHWWAGQSSDKSQVLHNTSDASGLRFERLSSEQSGVVVPHPTTDWNEGVIFAAGGDLDNDGRLDLFLGATDYPDQHGYLYRQQPGGAFVESGEAWNLRHACASGVAIADFDRDGDLDVILGAGTARDCGKIWSSNRVVFYENNASTHGQGVGIRLRGVTDNGAGIGARVTLRAGGREQTREIGGGYGHMAMQHDTVAFFGLGGCSTIDEVRVRWPSSPDEQIVAGVPVAPLVEITQGQAASKVIIGPTP